MVDTSLLAPPSSSVAARFDRGISIGYGGGDGEFGAVPLDRGHGFGSCSVSTLLSSEVLSVSRQPVGCCPWCFVPGCVGRSCVSSWLSALCFGLFYGIGVAVFLIVITMVAFYVS